MVHAAIPHKLDWVKVGELAIIWPAAQREYSESKAKEIADAFDPDCFGTLTICKPPGSKVYHTIDGWTRANAVKMMFGDNERVPIAFVDAKTEAEAAAIFVRMNAGRSKPTPIQLFNAQVAAKSVVHVAIMDILNRFGFKVNQSNSTGTMRCAGALIYAYTQHGGKNLQETLLIIQKIWGKDRGAFDAHIVRGMSDFLHANDVDMEKVIPKLTRKYTPGRLVGAAKATKEAFGGSVGGAVAKLLRDTAGSRVKISPPPAAKQKGKARAA